MSWLISFGRAYSSCKECGSRIIKWKKPCPQWDLILVPSAYEANALSNALLDLIYCEHLEVDRVLPEWTMEIYLYFMIDVVKYFVLYNILLTLYSQQTS